MDQSAPSKRAGLKGTPEKIREQLLAADLDMVSAWAEALVRTVEAHRLPTSEEAVLQRLADDLDLRTQACLRQLGDLTIEVGESDLLFADRIIYHASTDQGSIPAALYGAGVQQVTLRQGIESGELRALVNILRSASDESEQCSDDAVTLLWDQSFERVDYTCVSPVELERRESPGSPVAAAASGDGGIPWPMGHEDPDHQVGASGLAEERSDDWAFRVGDAAAQPEGTDSRFALTDVEAENIRMVARIEEVNSPQDQLLEILSMILQAEESPAEYLETASTMIRLLECEVEAGNVERATELIEQLRAIPGSKTASQAEFQAATEQVIQKIARPDLMVRFAAVLRSRTDVNLAGLTKFFVLLGTAAAPTLCDLLGETEDRRTRRALCEALAISCKNDVEVLIHRLWDPRWFVVRNLLYVLGRIGHHGVERALGEALYHDDVRVRREAVRALGGIDSPVSRAYLNSALRDPDRSVRILVAQTVVKRVDERAAQILWSVIESPEFAGRDSEERTTFFVALGRAGSDALVPRMEKILTRGGLFRSGPEGGRAEAAMALAWIGTPAALAVLNREVTSVREEVRRAVEQALEAMRKASERQQPAG
ncbi:MAG TPA: HEAT repeat domain-containing protein [Candidatus Eisenbacteria bacterium]